MSKRCGPCLADAGNQYSVLSTQCVIAYPAEREHRKTRFYGLHCFTIAALFALVAGGVLRGEEPPFYLGGRAADDLPSLTAEELASPLQQSMMTALAGDPYGHRAADHERAGCAMLVRRHAIPSNTSHYGGYWVGGGAPILGGSPTLEEGTFGWDYFGLTFSKRIALNWTHGRHQGGAGAYKTDGPRVKRH